MKATDRVHPITWEIQGQMVAEGGLTVRDHIAIEAMKAILSNPKLVCSLHAKVLIDVQEISFDMAYGMIEQSNKK